MRIFNCRPIINFFFPAVLFHNEHSDTITFDGLFVHAYYASCSPYTSCHTADRAPPTGHSPRSHYRFFFFFYRTLQISYAFANFYSPTPHNICRLYKGRVSSGANTFWKKKIIIITAHNNNYMYAYNQLESARDDVQKKNRIRSRDNLGNGGDRRLKRRRRRGRASARASPRGCPPWSSGGRRRRPGGWGETVAAIARHARRVPGDSGQRLADCSRFQRRSYLCVPPVRSVHNTGIRSPPPSPCSLHAIYLSSPSKRSSYT